MNTKEDYFRRKAAIEAERSKKASENWRSKLKNPIVLFTALLVVVGVLQCVVLVFQWRTFEKSDETLKAQQRPWIELNPVIDGDLGWSGDELTLPVHFDLKNSGHSPALNARQFSKTLLVWDDNLARKIEEQICEEFNKANEEGYGITIFPNAPPIRNPTTFEITKEEISKFKANPPTFPRPLVVGCASYFSSVDHSVHNTGFMYLIRPRPAQLPFELPKKPIPANSLDLIPWGSSRIN